MSKGHSLRRALGRNMDLDKFSETSHGNVHMSYLWSDGEIFTHKPPPLFKVFRSPEMHCVVLYGLPSHHQGVV